MYEYKYPKADITTDVVVFCVDEVTNVPSVLVVKRKNEPFKDCYALPGGFLDVEKETLVQCALRELQEETSLKMGEKSLHFVSIHDEPDRDPRGRVITAAYWTMIPSSEKDKVKAADDAAEVLWLDLRNTLDNIAFDHKMIIAEALTVLTVGMLTNANTLLGDILS